MVLGARQRCSKWKQPSLSLLPAGQRCQVWHRNVSTSEVVRESQTPRSLQHCRQLERALKLCKGYVSKKEMKFLNFFKAKKGRERNRVTVLVGCSTGCRTKPASPLSHVIIGILSFSFSSFFPPPPLPPIPFLLLHLFLLLLQQPSPPPLLLQVILSFWVWD